MKKEIPESIDMNLVQYHPILDIRSPGIWDSVRSVREYDNGRAASGNGLRRGQAACDEGTTGAEVSGPLSSLTNQADDDDDLLTDQSC